MLSFVERIPEYFYIFPFKNGDAVLYSIDAYQARLSECVGLFGIDGAQLFCTDLILWREVFHVIGSVLVLLILWGIRRRYGLRAMLIAGAVLFLYLVFQEFYLHPLYKSQIPFKGTLDIFSWSLIPLLYVALVIVRRELLK